MSPCGARLAMMALVLLSACDPTTLEECPPVAVHVGNLVEVGGVERTLVVERAPDVSIGVRAITWEGRTVVALPPTPAQAGSPVVHLREQGGQLVRSVHPVAHRLSRAPGEVTRRLLEQVVRYYELPETEQPAEGQAALNARIRQEARASVSALLQVVTRAQRGAVTLGEGINAVVVDDRTLELLDRVVGGVQEQVVALDVCVKEATAEQPLSKAGWQQLSRAVLASVLVGTVLVSLPASGATLVVGMAAGALIWAPTATLLALDLATTEPTQRWSPLAAAKSSLTTMAQSTLTHVKAKGAQLLGTVLAASVQAAELLSRHLFSEGRSETIDPDAQETCAPACGAGDTCVEGVCQALTPALSCQGRCCEGRDDACQGAEAACFCDAYCVEAGDCCADFVGACGG